MNVCQVDLMTIHANKYNKNEWKAGKEFREFEISISYSLFWVCLDHRISANSSEDTVPLSFVLFLVDVIRSQLLVDLLLPSVNKEFR